MRTLILILLLILPLTAQADESASSEYRHCLHQAKTVPDDGYEESLAWSMMGGGEPARHCMALARIGQKQYDDGAKRLEVLAQESHQSSAMRAEMLSQAAQAWILAGNFDRADADQRTALMLAPDQVDILVDNAVTLGEVHHYKEAAEILTRVLTTHPDRIDAMILRASARRFLDDRQGALNDIEHALLLDPADPDALLERGILRRLNGDDKGARADWIHVLSVAPTSPAADSARRNLEIMDVDGKK